MNTGLLGGAGESFVSFQTLVKRGKLRQEFYDGASTTYSFIKPYTSLIFLFGCGGGGGGGYGGPSAGQFGGAGGGAASLAYPIRPFVLPAFTDFNFTIGVGGSNGLYPSTPATAGGDTVFKIGTNTTILTLEGGTQGGSYSPGTGGAGAAGIEFVKLSGTNGTANSGVAGVARIHYDDVAKMILPKWVSNGSASTALGMNSTQHGGGGGGGNAVGHGGVGKRGFVMLYYRKMMAEDLLK